MLFTLKVLAVFATYALRLTCLSIQPALAKFVCHSSLNGYYTSSCVTLQGQICYKQTNLLSMNVYFLYKTRVTNWISIRFILPGTSIQLLFVYPENYVKIRLVILFLSRKKVHAKQWTVVLISSMKLGPGWNYSVIQIGWPGIHQ